MQQRLKKINENFIIIFLLVFLDQSTKFIFSDINFANSYFGLVSGKNFGSAFSLFSWVESYSLIIAIISIFLIFLLYYLREHFLVNIYSKLALLTFISGVIGNMIDRIFLGYVRDFFYINNFSIFNFADVYLSVGIILLLYSEYLEKDKEKLKNEKNIKKNKKDAEKTIKN